MKSFNLISTILYFIASILIPLSCKKDNRDKIIVNFECNTKVDGIKLSEYFEEIDFILLDTSFSVNKPPTKIMDYDNKYYVLWKYTKLGVYNYEGELLDSLISLKDSPDYIGNLHMFDIKDDTLVLLTGEKLLFYDLNNLKNLVKTVLLPDFYDNFISVGNENYALYYGTSTHLLQVVNQKGEIIHKLFETKNKIPTIRPDGFPHFTQVNNSSDILFYYQYDPTIYKVSSDFNILEYLALNLGECKINENEKQRLLSDPNNFEFEMNVANSKFTYFNDVYCIKDNIIFTHKLKGKYYYCWFNTANKDIKIFSYFINDVNILLKEKLYFLDLIGTDKNNFIMYVDPEFIQSNLDVNNSSKIHIKSNFNLEKNRISKATSPILVRMKIK